MEEQERILKGLLDLGGRVLRDLVRWSLTVQIGQHRISQQKSGTKETFIHGECLAARREGNWLTRWWIEGCNWTRVWRTGWRSNE